MQERLFEARETRRLVRHFGEVLSRLEARDVSALPRGARRRRTLQMRALVAYRERRRFPANERQRAPLPIFIDPHETRCAMAHLVDTSGARALVDRIASVRNFATIAELEDDDELREWLLAHGLTAGEAADIQPSYPGEMRGRGGFCAGTPTPTVLRVKVSVGDKLGNPGIAIEERYGPEAPTSQLAQRFASMTEGETLLVGVERDGTVKGAAWPVFRGVVSLENGIPDMKEAEAAQLMMSPTCVEGLRALRDHGQHPASAPATGGCGHCSTASGSLDAGSAALVLTAAIATATLLRRR